MLNSYHEAIQMLEKVLKYTEDSSYIHIWIANSYFKLQDYDKAIKHYEKALGSKANNALIHARSALIHNINNNQEKVEEYLTRANQEDPLFLQKSRLNKVFTP